MATELGEKVDIPSKVAWTDIVRSLKIGEARRLTTDRPYSTVRRGVSAAAKTLEITVSVHQLEDGGLALLRKS